jgi:hypothetical protein
VSCHGRWCHRLGMWINCQHWVATATVPLSGAAFHMICVSFMTLVSAMVLVAIPLLSPLVIGHGTLTTGMSITLPLLFDHHYSLLPCFGSEVEAPPSVVSHQLSIVSAKRLHTYLVYC